mmetsp:Transcript_14500/g.36218  ORF Transcript_14500/g.36218 Transcript_14500/m.36218 type:complete len:242 (-) Transcript_14500:571-1296(-)
MLWMRASGSVPRLVSMPITYDSACASNCESASSLALSAGCSSSSTPWCRASPPEPKQAGASYSVSSALREISWMKPRLIHMAIFFRSASGFTLRWAASEERLHDDFSAKQWRMEAWSGEHVTPFTVRSSKATSMVTVPSDRFHISFRGALWCMNCFSKRAISRSIASGSSNFSSSSVGQQSRETIVAVRTLHSSSPKCLWIACVTRFDSPMSRSITSQLLSASSPNRFLSSSTLRTSLSVS